MVFSIGLRLGNCGVYAQNGQECLLYFYVPFEFGKSIERFVSEAHKY
jgi:hypothetical protein